MRKSFLPLDARTAEGTQIGVGGRSGWHSCHPLPLFSNRVGVEATQRDYAGTGIMVAVQGVGGQGGLNLSRKASKVAHCSH